MRAALVVLALSLPAHSNAALDGVALHAGASLLRLSYSEYGDAGQLLDRETGFLPGVVFAASSDLGHWNAQVRLTHHAGDASYDGQTAGGRPVSSTTRHRFSAIESIATRWIGEQRRFGVRAGLGFVQWRRSIEAVSGVSGLDQTYRWGSAMLGAQATVHDQAALRVAVEARVTHNLRPSVEVRSAGLFDDKQLRLGSRFGARIAAPLELRFDRLSALEIEPGLEFWALGRSATETLTRGGAAIGTIFEPRSAARNLAVTLAWRQAF
ncbi:MAG: hypothetical protein WA210_05930 [Burkholderiaceae bacterium]